MVCEGPEVVPMSAVLDLPIGKNLCRSRSAHGRFARPEEPAAITKNLKQTSAIVSLCSDSEPRESNSIP